MLKVFNHPLITHKLALMRDENASTKVFRENLDEIAGLMAYEITRDIPTREVEVKTPMQVCKTQEVATDIIIVPILRAGLGMVNGIANLIPNAKIAHIGLYRDEETLVPHEYFAKYPKHMEDAFVMIVDPMLATGGSANAAITMVKKQGAKNIRLVCLVGVPEGIKAVEALHPDVDIYLAALDDKLNENGYILPGLGDAGDRIFGTK